ncbi:hypothetical protein BD324DRAFT_653940 [Kockovaella imperatae]|uniref:Uncharacterized protein n=1 Tax=Kockovaella imperatae TaxID=4999 RepID=A0A1Y1U6I2_9TREE|nr:hypothetical protein BD324DRAFT_653940 [Kockovaella imperatae]ORX33639.1 hypothetical protein BD324DRAFT_653940 [Kockovaella imperatae]
MLVISFFLSLLLTHAAPVRHRENASVSRAVTTPSSTSLDIPPASRKRHFPILEALYQTFDAYDSTLDSTLYASHFDPLKDGSGWPYASGSGPLMYVERVSKRNIQKRGRDLVIQDHAIQGLQYAGAMEMSDEDDQPVWV